MQLIKNKELHLNAWSYNNCIYARLTLWSYASLCIHLLLAKNAELPPKTTCYKIDLYIHVQLTLWQYTSKYAFSGLPKMQNHFRKVGRDERSKRYIIGKWVKNRRSTVSCLFLSSFALLFTFFSVYLPWTINGLQ